MAEVGTMAPTHTHSTETYPATHSENSKLGAAETINRDFKFYVGVLGIDYFNTHYKGDMWQFLLDAPGLCKIKGIDINGNYSKFLAGESGSGSSSLPTITPPTLAEPSPAVYGRNSVVEKIDPSRSTHTVTPLTEPSIYSKLLPLDLVSPLRTRDEVIESKFTAYALLSLLNEINPLRSTHTTPTSKYTILTILAPLLGVEASGSVDNLPGVYKPTTFALAKVPTNVSLARSRHDMPTEVVDTSGSGIDPYDTILIYTLLSKLGSVGQIDPSRSGHDVPTASTFTIVPSTPTQLNSIDLSGSTETLPEPVKTLLGGKTAVKLVKLTRVKHSVPQDVPMLPQLSNHFDFRYDKVYSVNQTEPVKEKDKANVGKTEPPLIDHSILTNLSNKMKTVWQIEEFAESKSAEFLAKVIPTLKGPGGADDYAKKLNFEQVFDYLSHIYTKSEPTSPKINLPDDIKGNWKNKRIHGTNTLGQYARYQITDKDKNGVKDTVWYYVSINNLIKEKQDDDEVRLVNTPHWDRLLNSARKMNSTVLDDLVGKTQGQSDSIDGVITLAYWLTEKHGIPVTPMTILASATKDYREDHNWSNKVYPLKMDKSDPNNPKIVKVEVDDPKEFTDHLKREEFASIMDPLDEEARKNMGKLIAAEYLMMLKIVDGVDIEDKLKAIFGGSIPVLPGLN
jgi:hypothetical protein